MKMSIRTIEHNSQRYDTVGDYFLLNDGETKCFLISKMGNEDFEFCVLIHELIEEHLASKRGIREREIIEFDTRFNIKKETGEIEGNVEPGDDPKCPYRNEHKFAENIERMIAFELGIDWEEYNAKVMSL